MKEKTKTKANAAAKRQPNEASAEVVAPKAEYQRERREISVDLLKFAPWNPRGKITPESVSDLVKSIGSLGVIQPLVAMLGKDGEAVLVAGHRRLVASDETVLKLREPVKVEWTSLATDAEAEDAMLSEDEDESEGVE